TDKSPVSSGFWLSALLLLPVSAGDSAGSTGYGPRSFVQALAKSRSETTLEQPMTPDFVRDSLLCFMVPPCLSPTRALLHCLLVRDSPSRLKGPLDHVGVRLEERVFERLDQVGQVLGCWA